MSEFAKAQEAYESYLRGAEDWEDTALGMGSGNVPPERCLALAALNASLALAAATAMVALSNRA